MDHGFPPDAFWHCSPGEIIAVHSFMSVVMVAILSNVVVSARRPADPWRPAYWGIVVTVLVAAYLILSAVSDTGTYGGFVKPTALIAAQYLYAATALSAFGIWLSIAQVRRAAPNATQWWPKHFAESLPSTLMRVIANSIYGLVLFLVISTIIPIHRSSVREAARRSDCRNKEKQLLRAAHEFKKANGDTWPRATTGNPAVSWRVNLHNWLDSANPQLAYDLTLPWNEASNEVLTKKRIPSLSCPSAWKTEDADGRFLTAYLMVAGPETIAPGDRDIHDVDITDGLSNTAFLVEAVGHRVVWSEPRDADVSQIPLGVNLKGTGRVDSLGLMSSYHPNGAEMVMADGRSRFINENIDPQVLKALTTIAGGERHHLPE